MGPPAPALYYSACDCRKYVTSGFNNARANTLWILEPDGEPNGKPVFKNVDGDLLVYHYTGWTNIAGGVWAIGPPSSRATNPNNGGLSNTIDGPNGQTGPDCPKDAIGWDFVASKATTWTCWDDGEGVVGGAWYTNDVGQIKTKPFIIEDEDSPCSCTQDDCQCVTSPNWPGPYGNDQTCRIKTRAGVPLEVHKFETEPRYDELTVNGEKYSGSFSSERISTPPYGQTNAYPSPHGTVLEGGYIEWKSDSTVYKNSLTQESGWKICSGIKEIVVTYEDALAFADFARCAHLHDHPNYAERLRKTFEGHHLGHGSETEHSAEEFAKHSAAVSPEQRGLLAICLRDHPDLQPGDGRSLTEYSQVVNDHDHGGSPVRIDAPLEDLETATQRAGVKYEHAVASIVTVPKCPPGCKAPSMDRRLLFASVPSGCPPPCVPTAPIWRSARAWTQEGLHMHTRTHAHPACSWFRRVWAFPTGRPSRETA